MLAQAIEFARLPGDFAQRRIIAAHIIHQCINRFNRASSSGPLRRIWLNSGTGSSEASATCCGCPKWRLNARTLGGAARLAFQRIPGDVRSADIHPRQQRQERSGSGSHTSSTVLSFLPFSSACSSAALSTTGPRRR